MSSTTAPSRPSQTDLRSGSGHPVPDVRRLSGHIGVEVLGLSDTVNWASTHLLNLLELAGHEVLGHLIQLVGRQLVATLHYVIEIHL